MVAFARVLAEEGEDLRSVGITTLICTGESLYPFQRKFLEQAFGARVVNEYGCSESGILAFPCPEADRLHTSADQVVLEYLVEGRPARPGEVAQVLLTELYSPDVPLIRYRLGDVVVPSAEEPCPCGRGLPTLERVEGRTSQVIQLGSGRQVHSEVFAYISDCFADLDPEIDGFRVRQKGDDDFMLQLVAPHTITSDTRESLAGLVRRVLGGEVKIGVEQVEELPRDPSGKLRYFVRDGAPEPERSAR
jgi:phenylacetate-CoA ligase